jgi:hypothetical protein
MPEDREQDPNAEQAIEREPERDEEPLRNAAALPTLGEEISAIQPSLRVVGQRGGLSSRTLSYTYTIGVNTSVPEIAQEQNPPSREEEGRSMPERNVEKYRHGDIVVVTGGAGGHSYPMGDVIMVTDTGANSRGDQNIHALQFTEGARAMRVGNSIRGDNVRRATSGEIEQFKRRFTSAVEATTNKLKRSLDKIALVCDKQLKVARVATTNIKAHVEQVLQSDEFTQDMTFDALATMIMDKMLREDTDVCVDHNDIHILSEGTHAGERTSLLVTQSLTLLWTQRPPMPNCRFCGDPQAAMRTPAAEFHVLHFRGDVYESDLNEDVEPESEDDTVAHPRVFEVADRNGPAYGAIPIHSHCNNRRWEQIECPHCRHRHTYVPIYSGSTSNTLGSIVQAGQDIGIRCYGCGNIFRVFPAYATSPAGHFIGLKGQPAPSIQTEPPKPYKGDAVNEFFTKVKELSNMGGDADLGSPNAQFEQSHRYSEPWVARFLGAGLKDSDALLGLEMEHIFCVPHDAHHQAGQTWRSPQKVIEDALAAPLKGCIFAKRDGSLAGCDGRCSDMNGQCRPSSKYVSPVGAEIVTHPATLSWLREFLPHLYKFLNEMEVVDAARCAGLHVHYSDRNISSTTRLPAIVSRFGAVLPAITGRDYNNYCQLIHTSTASDLVYAKHASPRHSAVNFSTDTSTVEFRLFNNSSDWHKVMARAELADALVTFDKQHSGAKILSAYTVHSELRSFVKTPDREKVIAGDPMWLAFCQHVKDKRKHHYPELWELMKAEGVVTPRLLAKKAPPAREVDTVCA